ncbi:hypothetical protein [Pseudorhodobacter ferrugineus]|uniref:hypothetical protein n=1 Tax=Pseudorhodobacter ferrugineus TaxID=77008 RepID=UPI0003B344B4|nr:hypothetical protein [Pseudorhodobacter ferrugineus]
MKRRYLIILGAVVVLGGLAYANRYALEHTVMSQMHGMGAGHMGGMGMGHMFKGVDTTEAEESELRAMFEGHMQITRTVENLPDGIRTVTETTNPKLRDELVSHVIGMIDRVDQGRDPRVMIQSPTLDILFKNRALIVTEMDPTDTGIIITQTSTDAETVAALQTHAAEVSDLAARGIVSAQEAMVARRH